MELFTGFAWAVPRAFASAVAACRFEQGDVLYDDPIAYAGCGDAGCGNDADATSGEAPGRDVGLRWGDTVRRLGHAVQILDPPRSARNAPADAVGNRFDANWNSPVTYELCDFRARTTTSSRTTQGRLFTCLWRGDVAWLAASDEEDQAAAPLPATARELHLALEQALPAVRRAQADASQGLLYTFVVDESSESSLAKMRAVEPALSARFRTTTADLAPDALGLGATFHPALRIFSCAIATSDEQAVRALLKGVLYAPARGAESDVVVSPVVSPVGSAVGSAVGSPGESTASIADPTPDRFRLERHGLLTPARD